jgi:small basic protein
MPSNAVLPAHAEEGVPTKLVLLIKSFFRVGFIEIAQLGALDRMLLVIMVIALVISLRYPREISSMYFLAVLLAVWAIGAINGTLGVNFRYQMPLLGFASWVILSNSSKFTDWFGRSRIDVVRKETQH